MHISIIIPTLNEATHIKRCISRLQESAVGNKVEIIVVDAESSDATASLATSAGASVYISDQKSRAYQMNFGASKAIGEIFYFVHADALPPLSCVQDILNAINEGYDIGRFRFKFDSEKFMLKINSWFTRFDKLWVSGGDETLFVKKEIFKKADGYDESFAIMEEYDFVQRVRKFANYKVIQKDVFVSARKYDCNSWMKVQKANFIAFKMFKKGIDARSIKIAYHKNLHHPKNDVR